MTFILPNHFINNYELSKKHQLQHSIQPLTAKLDDIFFVHYSTKQKNENMDVRITTHCMIILQGGKKNIFYKASKYSAEAKELLLLTQNNYFMSEILATTNRYQAILIYFNDVFLHSFVNRYNITLTPSTKQIVKIDYRQDQIFQKNIDILDTYLQKQLPNDFLKVKLEEILLYTLTHHTQSTTAFLSAALQTSSNRIQFLLQSNLDLIETLDDMCQFTKMSPNALRAFFKRQHGVNPKRWLDQQRLEKAKLLLNTSDESIERVAASCGYASSSWFIAKFKSAFGVTPKEFRYNT